MVQQTTQTSPGSTLIELGKFLTPVIVGVLSVFLTISTYGVRLTTLEKNQDQMCGRIAIIENSVNEVQRKNDVGLAVIVEQLSQIRRELADLKEQLSQK